MSAYQPGIRAMTNAATLRVIAVAAGLLMLAWLLSDVLGRSERRRLSMDAAMDP